MITYDTHRGLVFACTLRGSAFPKAFKVGLPAGLLAVALHFGFRAVEGFQYSGAGDVGASVLSGFTFILGFLIVFRSQQAYSRWWEGGTLMQQLRGEWFNAVSSCIAFCTTAKDKEEDVWKFEQTLVRLVSLLYCSALLSVSDVDPQMFEYIDLEGMSVESLEFMDSAHDRSEILLQWIQRLIVEATDNGIIAVGPPILSRVYNQLGNGIVILSNARKIKDYPFPFPLAQMITIMLVAHWMLTCFVVATSVEQASWAGFIAFAVTFSFWSVHFIGEELEQPFGDDPNDLPIVNMQSDLNSSLHTLLNPLARFPPRINYDEWGPHTFEVRQGDFTDCIKNLRARLQRGESNSRMTIVVANNDFKAPASPASPTQTWAPPDAGPQACWPHSPQPLSDAGEIVVDAGTGGSELAGNELGNLDDHFVSEGEGGGEGGGGGENRSCDGTAADEVVLGSPPEEEEETACEEADGASPSTASPSAATPSTPLDAPSAGSPAEDEGRRPPTCVAQDEPLEAINAEDAALLTPSSAKAALGPSHIIAQAQARRCRDSPSGRLGLCSISGL